MTIEAVLFDLDGTLVDSEPTHHRALVEVLARQGISLPDGFARAVTGLSLRAVYDLLVTTTNLTLDYDTLVAAKHAAYLRRCSELAFRPGARAALALVDESGLRSAVVSNSDRTLVEANLGAVGLLRPGLVTVCRSDVQRGKPDPDSYLRAAMLLGVAPASCIVVEDSVIGAAAGLAAGMKVVAWPEPHTNFNFPDGAMIAATADLAGFLADLLPGHSA